MLTALTIFNAFHFGAAMGQVPKCTLQGTMHTGGKFFDALDFGPAGRKVLKCNWQKLQTLMKII